MTDLTREKQNEARMLASKMPVTSWDITTMRDVLPALLDAADERDRLRAENEHLRTTLADMYAAFRPDSKCGTYLKSIAIMQADELLKDGADQTAGGE